MSQGSICYVYNCLVYEKPMHCFPRSVDIEIIRKWLAASGNQELLSLSRGQLARRFICHKHFETKYIQFGTNTLSKTAIPTLLLPEPIDSGTYNDQVAKTDIDLRPCNVDKTKVVENIESQKIFTSFEVSDVLSVSIRKSISQKKRSNVESSTTLELGSLYAQPEAGLLSKPSNFPKRKFVEISTMVAAKQTVPEVPLTIAIKEEPIKNEDMLEHIQMDLSDKNNTEIKSEPNCDEKDLSDKNNTEIKSEINFDEIVDKEFAEHCLEYTLKFLKQCSYSDVRQEIQMFEKLKNRWPQLK